MMDTSQKDLFIRSFLKNKRINENKPELSILAGDGSARIFERIHLKSLDQSFIIMENHPANGSIKKENLAYLKIGKHLFNRGIPVPEIYACDLDEGLFILEDMGDRNLQDEMLDSEDGIPLYEDVLKILLRIQIKGKEGFNTDWCCQSKMYDANLMREKEAHYFRDSFLINYMKLDFDAAAIEKSFDRIIMMADKAKKTFLLHRDFQSRNIMCRESGSMAILDWQGARPGPLAYDLASLLYDPYTGLSDHERGILFNTYCKILEGLSRSAVYPLKVSYPYIAVMRLLQALGAYSNLSIAQGKTYFKKYIPPALSSLRGLLEEINDPDLSYLERVIKELSKL
ncbi:aminoglycoside phosphotransferase family protein [Thermodesulfobacteriota bacterium]